jgi:hypothetical protein
MIPTEAVNHFVHRQKQLLRRTYDAAWAAGVAAYRPRPDPEEQPDTPKHLVTAGLTGAALLAARRAYPYVAPRSPDPVRRAVALTPAYKGLNAMAGELQALTPPGAAEGLSAPLTPSYGPTAREADGQALQDWVARNASRLNAGDSVAWSGEQAGYAEAANEGSQLLQWNDSGDDRTCSDCLMLGAMPPMPLQDWPCMPGDASTECNAGCRCSLDPIDMSVLPGDTYAPALSGEQQATVDKITAARDEAMRNAMPDVQYLE